MYQDCLSSTKWLRMFKPSMLYRTSKMSKFSRPTIFPEDQLVPLCCGSTTTDHRLMGGHWEATGRPLGGHWEATGRPETKGYRVHNGESNTYWCYDLAGLSNLHVIWNIPSIHCCSGRPHWKHNTQYHYTYIHTLQYTIQYILLPHNITVYPNTQFELQPHNTSPNHTVQEHTHHVYLTCSVHGLSEVVEQLEVLPTLQAPPWKQTNVSGLMEQTTVWFRLHTKAERNVTKGKNTQTNRLRGWLINLIVSKSLFLKLVDTIYM